MEPKGYEILKIETKINALEKELSYLFEGFKLIEGKNTNLMSYHTINLRR
tara:strand:+ start:72 stop:221 length:150 start_codon:yes stop_codon:yes gene_type:complete